MMFELKIFQENAIDYLINTTQFNNHKQKIVLESPTGSGKTIILISYIQRYLETVDDAVFVWLTPGAGDLEEQSQEKMSRFYPSSRTGTLKDVLQNGFADSTTYFINWEAITSTKNKALQDSERKNLFERISEGHSKNQNFIIIIDEEHQNDTRKANDIINSLNANFEIRVSATPTKRATHNHYVINENDVINEELITKAMYVNHELDVKSVNSISHETDILIEKADDIRRKMYEAYKEENEDIRPLVLIQFPNMNSDLIEQVENTLEEMGYTYENKSVARWFSPENSNDKKSTKLGKINIGTEGEDDGITRNDAKPSFLLFKQALSTGWDCPRAKILIKLRENMSESFEIQTLGRLRRMPKAKHYGRDILDCSYVYTFDENYRLSVLDNGAFETTKLFLKNNIDKISLIKETRDQDANYVDDIKIREKTYQFFVENYQLTKDTVKNKISLENNGYIFGVKIQKKFLSGRFIKLVDVEKSKNDMQSYDIEVSTHEHGIDRQHIINDLKKYVGLNYEKLNTILRNIFLRGSGSPKYKLLELSIREFSSFIINNEVKLKEDLKKMNALEGEHLQKKMNLEKEVLFTIPTEEIFRYKPFQSYNESYFKNVYDGYNTSMTTGNLRSEVEKLFENYCETSNKVKFIYKNGDKGINYFSILYGDYYGKQNLFYPDYIIQTDDGRIMILETKGGEKDGVSKNIDSQVLNKFKYFKQFCERHNYLYGFIRDKDGRLYVCNTEYNDDMNNTDSWKPIDTVL